MAIGNIGPRKTPMKEIAMELPIREGMNHIVISKLLDFEERKGSVNFGKELNLKLLTRLPEVRR